MTIRRTLARFALGTVTLVTAALGLAAPLSAQSAGETVDIVIGARYGAGGLQRLFLGDHYRDAWTSTVTLPVLDLRSFAGGLTPERMGGGQQTISLVLRGEDGRRYSFRLIDKDPTPALPPELRETAADALLQDQISASHPLGILIVQPLEEAAGVLHAESRPFIMPDDPALGEFRETFAGQAGVIAERPGDEADEDAIFGGFDNIDGSNRIFRRVAESHEDRVDARAFLNARLLDLVMGDWDRHRGQWTWARRSGSRDWLPIPEDRDQAFSRLDGLLPSSAHAYVRQLVGFHEEYPGIYGLHHQARELDRRFLAELGRDDWDAGARELQSKLTDAVIDDAVRRLPDVMYELDGAFLARSLEARRDALPAAAGALYEFLAIDVEVHLTDLADEVRVTSMADGRVEVSARPADGGDVFFRRTFDPAETEEIRIFMGDADDVAVLDGTGRLGSVVRIVGGGGDDEVRYDQDVGAAIYYDAAGRNRVTGSAPGTSIRTAAYEPPPTPEDDHNTPPHSGSWTVPLGSLLFTSEYGLVARFGATRFGYGFRRDPYASRARYGGGISTQGRFEGRLAFDFYRESSGQHFSLELFGTQFGLVNFYGFGNETPEFALPDSSHVLMSTISVEPRYGFAVGENGDLGVGLFGRYSNADSDDNPFLPSGVEPEPLYGAGHFLRAGAFAEFSLDTRDVPGAPTQGATLAIRGTYTPALFDVDDAYGSLEGTATTYLSAVSAPLEPTLALRAGAKRVWGEDIPFFDAAFVGGGATLRGFDLQRFAGDTALYGTAELRLFLFRLGFLTLGDFGLLGFADAGRVYVDGESPGDWHSSFGGGVWLGILGRANGLSAAIASGDNGSRVHIAFGMPF
ncbi:MAG: outer membrane protein assembly factor [Gemmatimonadetes bacterium]|nr:outer membrane protein assembly factor [Gemmatimonadota bacterium]